MRCPRVCVLFTSPSRCVFYPEVQRFSEDSSSSYAGPGAGRLTLTLLALL